jgi:hypothetical protein
MDRLIGNILNTDVLVEEGDDERDEDYNSREKPFVMEIYKNENISIIYIHNCNLIDKDKLEIIFMYTIQYTAAAFLVDDIDKMTKADRLDHFQHTFDGKHVFLLGCIDTNNKDNFNIYCHVCFHEHCANSSSRYDNSVSNKILFVNAICCDPSQQGHGFGTMIMTKAISKLKTNGMNFKYLTLRTMNHAVIKLITKALQKTIQEDGKLPNNDASNVNCNDNTAISIYPVNKFDYNVRADLIDVFNVLANKYSWKNCIPNELIIKNAYPKFLVPVFQGKKTKKHDVVLERISNLIDQECGDAMCCIIDLITT